MYFCIQNISDFFSTEILVLSVYKEGSNLCVSSSYQNSSANFRRKHKNKEEEKVIIFLQRINLKRLVERKSEYENAEN